MIKSVSRHRINAAERQWRSLLAQLVVLLAELINLNNCKVIRIQQETAEATPWPLRAAATE